MSCFRVSLPSRSIPVPPRSDAVLDCAVSRCSATEKDGHPLEDIRRPQRALGVQRLMVLRAFQPERPLRTPAPCARAIPAAERDTCSVAAARGDGGVNHMA